MSIGFAIAPATSWVPAGLLTPHSGQAQPGHSMTTEQGGSRLNGDGLLRLEQVEQLNAFFVNGTHLGDRLRIVD